MGRFLGATNPQALPNLGYVKKKNLFTAKRFFNIAQVWQRSLKATIGPIVACHQATALDLCMASCFGSSTEDFLSVILISRDGRNP